MATSDSDLPYVRGEGRNIMAQPVFPVDLTDWTNRSGTVAQATVPFQLFAAIPDEDKTISRRFVAHVGDADSGSLWINWLGDVAGVGAPGSLELMPGDIMPIPTRGAVSALGTMVGLAFTAAEG